MTPGELLAALDAAGIRVGVKDGIVTFRGIKAAYTDALKGAFTDHRQELLVHWRCLECGVFTATLYGIAPVLRCLTCAARTDPKMEFARKRLRAWEIEHMEPVTFPGSA